MDPNDQPYEGETEDAATIRALTEEIACLRALRDLAISEIALLRAELSTAHATIQQLTGP